MGFSLEVDEELYLFRMSMNIDENTCASSFHAADLKRLEQLIIDVLG